MIEELKRMKICFYLFANCKNFNRVTPEVLKKTYVKTMLKSGVSIYRTSDITKFMKINQSQNQALFLIN